MGKVLYLCQGKKFGSKGAVEAYAQSMGKKIATTTTMSKGKFLITLK